jgi:hypothetical protein
MGSGGVGSWGGFFVKNEIFQGVGWGKSKKSIRANFSLINSEGDIEDSPIPS